MPSAASSHLPSRVSSDTTPYLHLYLTPCLSPFLRVRSLSPGACQSLLVTKWFVGAPSSANFSLPLSLTLFFLVPVTRLIQRGALRPGNEGNGRSVKHLLFNRALLPAFCPHQEARSWTRWMTDWGTSSLTLMPCLPLRQWWLTCQQALHGTSVPPTDRHIYLEAVKVNACQAKELSHSMSKSRAVNFKGWRANRAGLCGALTYVWVLFRGQIVYFQKEI